MYKVYIRTCTTGIYIRWVHVHTHTFCSSCAMSNMAGDTTGWWKSDVGNITPISLNTNSCGKYTTLLHHHKHVRRYCSDKECSSHGNWIIHTIHLSIKMHKKRVIQHENKMSYREKYFHGLSKMCYIIISFSHTHLSQGGVHGPSLSWYPGSVILAYSILKEISSQYGVSRTSLKDLPAKQAKESIDYYYWLLGYQQAKNTHTFE